MPFRSVTGVTPLTEHLLRAQLGLGAMGSKASTPFLQVKRAWRARQGVLLGSTP